LETAFGERRRTELVKRRNRPCSVKTTRAVWIFMMMADAGG
jgi:hypothetical protein